MSTMFRFFVPLPLRVFLKARQIDRELEKLREAKRRRKKGILQTILLGVFDFVKAAILRPFCPCVIHDLKADEQERLLRSRLCTRLCTDGTIENKILKSFLGFVAGLLLGFAFFAYLVYTVHVPVATATYTSAVLGLGLSFGLAFTLRCRCLIFLILPQFTSKRGRTILMAYVYILVIAGPIRNLTNNVNVMSDSLICQQEMIKNKTAEIMRTAFSPILDYLDSIRRVLDAIVLFSRLVKEAFQAFLDLFKEILRAIRKSFQWLRSIMQTCPKLMKMPEEACWNYLMEKKRKCYSYIVFVFLCELVTVFAKMACPFLKAAQVACEKLNEFQETIMKRVEERIEELCNRMYESFYLNITTYTYYNYSVEQSQSISEISEAVMTEVKENLSLFETTLDFSGVFLSLGFIWLILKAIIYRWRYLSSDKYDNIYVTWHVREMDMRRFKANRETILPLRKKQKRKYISPFSLKLSRTERRKLTFSSMFFTISAVQIGYYVFLDYLLYWLLDRIAFHGNVHVKLPVPFNVHLQVEGEGLLADMYRDMVDVFNPLLMYAPALDTTKCLPKPFVPDFNRYKLIGGLVMLSFFLAVVGAYGLRLRHMICACYYPERENMRAIWLYNHILQTQTSYLKHIRNMIQRNYRDGHDSYGPSVREATIMEYLAHKHKFLLKLFRFFGYEKVICLGCKASGSPEDTINFKKCSNPTCDALYCTDCYTEVGNLCAVCLTPVEDEGELSDEVKDSSEDEKTQPIV